jgi:hypothetical protein
MTERAGHRRFHCRFCGVVLAAWFPMPGEPDGAIVLGHLGRNHPD